MGAQGFAGRQAHPDQGRTAGADEGAAAALLLRPGRQADRAFRDQGAARPRAPEWPGARGQRGLLAFPTRSPPMKYLRRLAASLTAGLGLRLADTARPEAGPGRRTGLSVTTQPDT